MRKLIVVLICLCGISCEETYDKYSRANFHSTDKIADGLYVEFYTVYATGYSTTNIESAYLTDSTSFYHYMLTLDVGPEVLSFRTSGDSIIVQKFKDKSNTDNTKVLDETKVLFLSRLKQLDNYKSRNRN